MGRPPAPRSAPSETARKYRTTSSFVYPRCGKKIFSGLEMGTSRPSIRSTSLRAGTGSSIARVARESRSSRRGAEDLLQLRRRRLLELIVPAFLRSLVRAPAQESGRMPEPIALQVIVRHLADALDPQRFPGEVLSAVPARRGTGHALIAAPLRPLAPGVLLGGVFPERRELLHH